MSGYTPTVWAAGDTVTAAKLNKMEQGIADGYSSGGGGLVISVTVDGTNAIMNKTWQEIYDAFTAGQNVVIHRRNEDEYGFTIYEYKIETVYYDSESSLSYGVSTSDIGDFFTESASGYPSQTLK